MSFPKFNYDIVWSDPANQRPGKYITSANFILSSGRVVIEAHVGWYMGKGHMGLSCEREATLISKGYPQPHPYFGSGRDRKLTWYKNGGFKADWARKVRNRADLERALRLFVKDPTAFAEFSKERTARKELDYSCWNAYTRRAYRKVFRRDW